MYKVTREVLTTTSEKKSGFDNLNEDFEKSGNGGLKKSGYSYRLSRGKDFRSTDEEGDAEDWQQENEGSNTFSRFHTSSINNIKSSGISSHGEQNMNRSSTLTTGTMNSQMADKCTCCPYGYHVNLDFLRHLNADEYENVKNDPQYLLKHHKRLHEMQQQQFQQRADSSTTTNTASINSQILSSTQHGQQSHSQLPTFQPKLQQPSRSPYQSTTTLQQQQQQQHYDRDDHTYENAVTLYGKNLTNTTSSSATGSYQQRHKTNGYTTANNTTSVITNGFPGNDGNDVRRQEMVYIAENGATTTRVIEEVHRTRTTIINLDSDEEDENPPDELEKPDKRPNNERPKPPKDYSPEPSSPGFDVGEKFFPKQKTLVELQRKLQLIQPVDQKGPLRTYVNEASPRPIDEKEKEDPSKKSSQPKPLDLDFLDSMETEREEYLKQIEILEKDKQEKERFKDIINDLKKQLLLVTEENDKFKSHKKMKQDIGVGDYEVDEPVQQPIRIHEKELNTEETTEIREKEIKTIFVTGIDDKFSLATTTQPNFQFLPKESRSIGVGEGDVFEDNQKKFEVHEKELRTVYLGGPDVTKVPTRNVGILCKAAMRDVGMVHTSDEEKPMVRNIAIGAGEIGISESDVSTSFEERSKSIALNRAELVNFDGRLSTADELGNDEAYFASSGFCQTTLTNLKGGLANMRSDQLKIYLDELLKREIHSVGIQCQFSTENKGTDAGRVGYDIASIGVSEDTIDVDVVPIRVMKSVAVDNRPSLFHHCVGTEFIYKLDVGTNTRTQGLFLEKSSNTEPKPIFSVGVMTEPKRVFNMQTGTDLATFYALDLYRTMGTMTDDIDMYNKRINTEMDSEEYEQRIATTNRQASNLAASISTSGVQEVRTDEEKATGYRRYVEETVTPGYLVSYTKTSRTRSRPSTGQQNVSGSSKGYSSSTVVQTTRDKSITDQSPLVSKRVQFGDNTAEVTNKMLGLERTTESKRLIGSDGRTQIITETKSPGYKETIVKESYSSSDGKTVGIPLVPGMTGFPDQFLPENRKLQQSSSTFTTEVPVESYSGYTSSSTTSTMKTESTSGIHMIDDKTGPFYYTEKTVSTNNFGDQIGDNTDFITTLQDGNKIITQVQCPGYVTSKVFLDKDASKRETTDGLVGARLEFDSAGTNEQKFRGVSGVVTDVRSGDGMSAVITNVGENIERSSYGKSSKTFESTSSISGAGSTGGVIALRDQDGGNKLTFSGNPVGVKTVIKESYGPNNIKTVTTEKVDMATNEIISSSTTQSHYDSFPTFDESSAKSSSLSSTFSDFSKSTFGFARSGITSEKFIPDEDLSSCCEMYILWLKDRSKVNQTDLDNCKSTLQKRWFHLAGAKESSPYLVDGFLNYLKELSPDLLKYIINCTDANNNSVLHYAISYNNLDIVNTILNTNLCNVDQPNAAGYTPLMLAALTVVPSTQNRDTLKKLFAIGNINAKSTDITGQTPLMLAVGHNRLDTVDLLLSTGHCDVNMKDSDGSSALMCAAEKGYYDIVKLLLSTGKCDIQTKDNDGMTALSIAREAGHQFVVSLLESHLKENK